MRMSDWSSDVCSSDLRTAQCPVGNQRFRTHDAIAVTWVAMLRQAGFLCRMEDPSCFREMQDSNKRADIVVENGRVRGRAILDVSVTHPWTQSSLRGGGDPNPECAATLRESGIGRESCRERVCQKV